MKLCDILSESDNEDKTINSAPAPGQLGEYITTAQAAKILGVTMSRVRQLIMDNRLITYSPVPGRRDNFLKIDAVQKYKSDRKEKIKNKR